MKKGYIKRGMRNAGNTEARKEQAKLNKILRGVFFESEVRMEYPISSDGVLVARLDVAIVDKRIGYRIMGESHIPGDPYDISQKERLEKMGWIIHDVWWDLSPELWED